MLWGTPEATAEGLFKLAKAEVKGIISGKGDLHSKPDERRPFAESLAGVEEFSSVFEKVTGLAPERSGLK